MAGSRRSRPSGARGGVTRRDLLAWLPATGVVLAAPAVIGQARPRVVVVGGGPGGVAATRRMAPVLDVTLVEPNPIYRTCFFSNLAIGGFIPFAALAHDYAAVTGAGVRLVPGRAVAVETAEVVLQDGTRLGFDRCILAPGIAFRDGSLPGWSPADEALVPSAYVTGGDPERIRQQVLALPEGGTFCLVAPPNPSRCPPAPYERVSMVAHLLKRSNPRAKILIVDPKDGFAKQALFEEGWQAHYTGMIDRIGPEFGTANLEIRPATREVVIDGEVEAVDALNVIPAQRAADIAQAAGVVEDSGWAPVEPEGMRARLRPGIHVIGDAAAPGGIPKAASAAVSEGQGAADAILAELAGIAAVAPRHGSACWSVIAEGDAVEEVTRFEPGPAGFEPFAHRISQTGEDPAIRRTNWDAAFAWYAAITAETFG